MTCVWIVLDGVVAWSNKKQNMIGVSSTKSEYMAVCQTSCDFVWFNNLITEMLITVQSLVIMCEDNMSCIHRLSKPNHSSQKHMDVKFHFVK